MMNHPPLRKTKAAHIRRVLRTVRNRIRVTAAIEENVSTVHFHRVEIGEVGRIAQLVRIFAGCLIHRVQQLLHMFGWIQRDLHVKVQFDGSNVLAGAHRLHSGSTIGRTLVSIRGDG